MILPTQACLDSQAATRRAFAQMSATNLQDNVRQLQHMVGDAKLIAMVKANGFGHGIRSCALQLESLVSAFGVAHVEEARVLREVGITNTILLMEGVYSADEMALADRLQVDVVVHTESQVDWLAELDSPSKLRVWLKVDTGMGRLGCDIGVFNSLYKRLQRCSKVAQPVGIMSHLACASQPDHPLNTKQLAHFKALRAHVAGPASVCNSAAIMHFKEHYYDYVRPGLAMYGVSPTALPASSYGLKSVMTLKSKVIAVKIFQPGQSIGYDAKYVCQQVMRVAIVAIGYGDGYPRNVATDANVLINGVRCRIVGSISMDMLSVDVSHCAEAVEGDEVTLWGVGLPIEEVARFSKRSCYELLTSVQHRVKFIWT
tara:strand:+ start:96 stop:1211 length:1116 start_codon:yes stop_codon:yes gene_type:complete